MSTTPKMSGLCTKIYGGLESGPPEAPKTTKSELGHLERLCRAKSAIVLEHLGSGPPPDLLSEGTR